MKESLTAQSPISRGDGKRYIVRVDEKLTAFLELESAIRAGGDFG